MLVVTHQVFTVVNAHHRISKVIRLNLAASMYTGDLSEAHIIRCTFSFPSMVAYLSASFHTAYMIYPVRSYHEVLLRLQALDLV